MRITREDQKARQRQDMALILVLLGGVQVGVLASLIGVLLDNFLVGIVVAQVPGAVVMGIWWRRFLD